MIRDKLFLMLVTLLFVAGNNFAQGERKSINVAKNKR